MHRTGEVVSRKSGGQVEGLHLILSGRIAMYVDRGGGRHKAMEWRAGDVTGLLPYSRLVAPPGDTVAEEPTETVAIHRDDFPQMIQTCHQLTTKLVHVMLDRARRFTTSDLHDEKMVSLGKLAAGLAHELNNPASALVRSAKLLSASFGVSDAASRALGAARLSEAQAAAIESVREACEMAPVHRVLSPLEAADRENAFSDWLEDHDVESALADALADTAVTIEGLDQLARSLEGAALESALRWIGSGCSARRLTVEIEEAAARIFDLVSAVKGFTHMDLAPVSEPVDVGKGLAQTLTVLGAKARSKSLSVRLSLEPDLPRAHGVAGELNQVWANLIDNALDAAEPSGKVEIQASQQGGHIRVAVLDDGPGVPSELRDRIFDPFFTTKAIGQGTGLGLDIARRLVRKHSGDLEMESEPGRTEFRVSIPIWVDRPQGGDR